MLYNALRRRLPVIVAAPIQAVIFALVHPFGLAYRAGIAVIGLALAVFYEWRKTLVAPMLLHAMINADGDGGHARGARARRERSPSRRRMANGKKAGVGSPRSRPAVPPRPRGSRSETWSPRWTVNPWRTSWRWPRSFAGKGSAMRVSVEFTRGGTAQRVEAVLKPLPQ